MAYKTILANLPTPDRVKPVPDVAVPLARKHHAHLIGLLVGRTRKILGMGIDSAPVVVAHALSLAMFYVLR